MLPTLIAVVMGLAPLAGQTDGSARHPGHVVLLAVAPAEEAVALLASALRHPDPATRTAAARVLGARNDLNPAPALVQALTVEQNENAAAEQIRALLIIRGEAALDVVSPHARRIGGVAAATFLGWLARHQPATFPDRLAVLGPVVRQEAASLLSTVTYAAREIETRDAVLRAWMPHANLGEWKRVLDATFTEDADLQHSLALIVDSLSSTQAHIRDDTVWFVVNAIGRGRTLPLEVIDAALPADVTPAAPDWEHVGRELVARRLRDAKLPDRTEWLTSRVGHNRRILPAAASLLSRREREVMKLDRMSGEPSRRTALPSGERAARTIVEWMPGLLRMTADAAGCPLPEAAVHGYARVTYDAEGRASRLALDQKQLPSPCRPVLAALARTGLADFTSDIGSGDQQWHVLPLSKRFAACTARPLGRSFRAGEEYDGQRMTTPRQVKDVTPRFPQEMLANGVEGMAIIDAIVDDAGCVRGLEVVSTSGANLLDLAALVAVGQWEFEPTRLGGRPVPVRTTVILSFSVSR